MRCEQCGRPIKNAQMWELQGNASAPQSRSMRQLCWDCRKIEETDPSLRSVTPVVAEATEIARRADEERS